MGRIANLSCCHSEIRTGGLTHTAEMLGARHTPTLRRQSDLGERSRYRLIATRLSGKRPAIKMLNLNVLHKQRCLHATLRLRVDGRILQNPRKNRLFLEISAFGVRFALRPDQESSPNSDSFGWVSVMNFDHRRSSTDGHATTEAQRPVCRCLNVEESDILEAIYEYELQTVQGVSQICGAGAGCMACHRHIRRLLIERGLCRS